MRISILMLISFFSLGLAQAQNVPDEVKSLENDYKSFKYNLVLEKGAFLLGDSFTAKSDSLVIFQLMLSSAYALNDTTMARKIINDILECDPQFNLDTKKTSPKIIELFNVIKKQSSPRNIEPQFSDKNQSDSLFTIHYPIEPYENLASVLFPGSGHLLSGRKTIGFVNTSISTLLLGGIVFSVIETDNRRDKYHSARGEANFDQFYDKYNNASKLRNGLIISYCFWSLYNLFDLHNKILVDITYQKAGQSINVGIKKSF